MDNDMERALIIQKKWIDLILNNGKTWEMRTTKTNISGKIGLIEAGSGMIFGEAFLLGCGEELTAEEAIKSIGAHQVRDLDLLKKWKYPWFLEDVKKYANPVRYRHKKGSAIWVRLDI